MKKGIFLQACIWLLVMAAMVGSVAGQTLPAPVATSDSVWYTQESGLWYETRYTVYDNGGNNTVKTYVGTTEAEAARRARGVSETETQALAEAVKLVSQRALILEVAEDRYNGNSDVPTWARSSISAAASLLSGYTWDTPEGDMTFVLDGGEISWSTASASNRPVTVYGSRVVTLLNYPTIGEQATFYQVSEKKWTTYDGAESLTRE